MCLEISLTTGRTCNVCNKMYICFLVIVLKSFFFILRCSVSAERQVDRRKETGIICLDYLYEAPLSTELSCHVYNIIITV